jgi:hypothetical protein
LARPDPGRVEPDQGNQSAAPPHNAIMPRPKPQCETLTISQLAKRWHIDRAYARDLAEQEEILEAFTLPSTGRHGKAVRIPIASVLQAQRHWANHPEDNPLLKRQRRRPTNGHSQKLKHFPELQAEPGDDAECPGDDQH